MRDWREVNPWFPEGAGSLFPVVAAAEIFLQPEVGADEEIAAAHLLDLELGLAVFAVLPGDGDDRPRVAADDGLQGDLDGQVEMRREQGPAALDDSAAIGLESVGGVVERDVEADADKEIGEAIDPELQARVVDDLAAFDETAAEDAVPSLLTKRRETTWHV